MMDIIRAHTVRDILKEFLTAITRKEVLSAAGLETRQTQTEFIRKHSVPLHITVRESARAAESRQQKANHEFEEAYRYNIFHNTAGNVPPEAAYPPIGKPGSQRGFELFGFH